MSANDFKEVTQQTLREADKASSLFVQYGESSFRAI